MALILLHSGSFTDYEGNTINVQLYKHRDLNASPTSLNFTAIGGILKLAIWSYDGDANLNDIQYDWLNYKFLGKSQLPGSECYRYYYNISCKPNTGTERTGYLTIGLDSVIDDDYIYRPTITIPVIQRGKVNK